MPTFIKDGDSELMMVNSEIVNCKLALNSDSERGICFQMRMESRIEEEEEPTSTIKVFDDISKELFSDQVLVWVCETWGGTRMPQLLYKSAVRLGVERVKATVREVRKATGIRNRGGYLRRVLERMT